MKTTRPPRGHDAGRGRYDDSLHPRDSHGHWITTTGGYRRKREGTDARRAALARAIRNKRAGVRTNLEHTQLALRVRKMRAARRGQLTPKDRKGRRPTIDVVRRQVADRAEKRMADMLGGKRLKDYEAYDVHVPRVGKTGTHVIEVKTSQFGARPTLSVHDNALVRKADHARSHKEDVFHTVLLDLRKTSEGGIHAHKYSGHDIYYRRASGPYAIAKMYKVKDIDELSRLIAMPDKDLPRAARGKFPRGEELAVLREKAAKERAYNNDRSAKRKKLLGPAAYGR